MPLFQVSCFTSPLCRPRWIKDTWRCLQQAVFPYNSYHQWYRLCYEDSSLWHYAMATAPVLLPQWASTETYMKLSICLHAKNYQFLHYRHLNTEDNILGLNASLVAQLVKNTPAMQETRIWTLGQKDRLEKEMATHPSILSWRIP